MRRILSTAFVALVVGALAGGTVGALAQDPADPAQTAVAPAAGINADRVDGKHAVSFGASSQQRAGKLVATNGKGLLPSNIVKPFWDRIRGMPDGFRDGVDDGITRITFELALSPNASLAANSNGTVSVTCPAGTKLWNGGGTASNYGVHMVSSFQSGNGWLVAYQNTTAAAQTITAVATCATVMPASAVATAGKHVNAADFLPDR